MSSSGFFGLSAYASRRDFLARAGNGFGLLALGSLLADSERVAYASALGRRSARAEEAALPRQGQVGHLAVHERRAAPGRYLGLQAGTRPSATARSSKGFDKNTGFFTEQVGPLMKSPFKFAQHGQSGAWVSEIFPEHGQARRQDGLHPFVLDRFEQSLAGPVQDQHRHDPHGLSLPRLVGDLWPRQREPEPAGVLS